MDARAAKAMADNFATTQQTKARCQEEIRKAAMLGFLNCRVELGTMQAAAWAVKDYLSEFGFQAMLIPDTERPTILIDWNAPF